MGYRRCSSVRSAGNERHTYRVATRRGEKETKEPHAQNWRRASFGISRPTFPGHGIYRPSQGSIDRTGIVRYRSRDDTSPVFSGCSVQVQQAIKSPVVLGVRLESLAPISDTSDTPSRYHSATLTWNSIPKPKGQERGLLSGVVRDNYYEC